MCNYEETDTKLQIENAIEDKASLDEEENINGLKHINEFYDGLKKNYYCNIQNDSLKDTPHNSFDNEKIKEENNWSVSQSSSVDTVKEFQSLANDENKKDLIEISKNETIETTPTNSPNTIKNEENLKAENLETKKFGNTENSNTILNYEIVEELQYDMIEKDIKKINEVIKKKTIFPNEKTDEKLGKISIRSYIENNSLSDNKQVQDKLIENTYNKTNIEFENFNKNLQNNLNKIQANQVNLEFKEFQQNDKKNLNIKTNSECEKFNKYLEEDKIEKNKLNSEFNKELQENLNNDLKAKINLEFEDLKKDLQENLISTNPDLENIQVELEKNSKTEGNLQFKSFNDNLQKKTNKAAENKINSDYEDYNENQHNLLDKKNRINIDNKDLQNDLESKKNSKKNKLI